MCKKREVSCTILASLLQERGHFQCTFSAQNVQELARYFSLGLTLEALTRYSKNAGRIMRIKITRDSTFCFVQQCIFESNILSYYVNWFNWLSMAHCHKERNILLQIQVVWSNYDCDSSDMYICWLYLH